jgi:hypothetical protein
MIGSELFMSSVKLLFFNYKFADKVNLFAEVGAKDSSFVWISLSQQPRGAHHN